jgi:fatty acid desaturase
MATAVSPPRALRPGTMVLAHLPAGHDTGLVRADGRIQPEVRPALRKIPSWRNAWSVLWLLAQTGAVLVATVVWAPWVWPVTFVLMGRAHAQFASLMHEAAHRLLFTNRRANDLVGRWVLGYPSFTPTDAYRRSHMAHHREEFGPDEPDVLLYRGYPISTDSLRRKLVRDVTGRTGLKLMRGLFRAVRSTDPATRRFARSILGTQLVLLAAAVLAGRWWLYPFFWVLPYLTVWRVINRLRSIAEHGGLQRSKDRRETTHSVRQHWLARFLLVPYHIGCHLAHHVDSGVPFRNLPRYHRALAEAGYVDDTVEYPSYPSLWRALGGGAPPASGA